MKVTEHLERRAEPFISFEIIPPLRGSDISKLMRVVEELVAHRPPFIDITSHSAVLDLRQTPDGLERRVRRKRPGTLGICALVQNKYGVDAVPHVLCSGFTREESEDFLIELRYLGIDNVLALRGDEGEYTKPVEAGRSVNATAADLVQQIAGLNRGEYLDFSEPAEPTAFCIGAAAYPEKHFAAPDSATDMKNLQEKVSAGAEYLVTQMFFENRHYFDFEKECREAGIQVPIIPGLKILTSKAQLQKIPRTFYCEMPHDLVGEVEAAKDEHVMEIGVAWATKQVTELLQRGAPSVHFYVMQSAKSVNLLMQQLHL